MREFSSSYATDEYDKTHLAYLGIPKNYFSVLAGRTISIKNHDSNSTASLQKPVVASAKM